MRHLVIGRGQVGSALIEVLSGQYEVESIDKGGERGTAFEVIHVCIPYGHGFVTDVTNYKLQYLAEPGGLVIVHSSVAVGTCARLNAVHSPIRGVHPNLAEGIRTFVKFFGGARALEAGLIFKQLGIEICTTPDARNTEALKLWDTTYYGWNIVFQKAVKEFCDKHALDYDMVYNQENLSYNKGYAALGVRGVQRPVLRDVPGPIGGHCVIPNARLLDGDIADTILAFDAEYHDPREVYVLETDHIKALDRIRELEDALRDCITEEGPDQETLNRAKSTMRGT